MSLKEIARRETQSFRRERDGGPNNVSDPTRTTATSSTVRTHLLYFGVGFDLDSSGAKKTASIWMGLRPPHRNATEFQWFRKQTESGKWVLTMSSDIMSASSVWYTHQEEVAATHKKDGRKVTVEVDESTIKCWPAVLKCLRSAHGRKRKQNS